MLAGAHQRKQNSHNFWRVGTLTILATLIFSLGFAVAGRENAHATSPAEPNTWTLLAAGNKTEVFKSTSSNTSTGNNTSNGAFWYNYSGRAIGFSPTDTINIALGTKPHQIDTQNLSDCNSDNKGDLRLSAALYTGAREYYWYVTRIGCVETYNHPTATSVIGYYEADNPTYYPTGPQVNVSRSTLIAGGWTLCAITDLRGATERENHVITPCDKAKILMAGHSSYQSAPTVSTFSSITATPRNDSNASYSVVFSQSVTGLSTEDFENAGNATGCTYSVTGSGTTYTLSISSCSDGTIQPRIKTNSVSGSTFDGPASAATTTSTITKDSVAPTPTATTETITAGNSGVFSLGSTGPGGGKVFHVSSSGFACGPTLSQTCHYLEAAPTSGASAWSDGIRDTVWSGNTNTATGATGTAIGTGYKNTLAIISQNNTSNRAASKAQSYRGPNNFSDWYLPSKDELFEMYSRQSDLSIAPGPSNDYWSSSESSATKAWYYYMGSATWNNDTSKGDRLYVRAIRAFARNHVVVRSSEAGSAYLVNETINVSNLASITSAADNLQNSVSVLSANTDTNLSIAGLISGTYKLYTVDGTGNLSAASASTITIKPAGPDTPDLKATSDLGTSDTDNSTSDDTPTFDVSSIEIGTEVILTATPSSGNPVTCSFVAAGTSGSCTFTSLGNSTYSITAVQSRSGINSDTSTALANVVINKTTISTPATPDLHPDSDTGISNSDNLSKDNTPTISVSGTFTGTAIITASKTGSTSVTCNVSSNSCTLGTLSDGDWSLTVKDQDSAGNSATSSALSITINATASAPSVGSLGICAWPGCADPIQVGNYMEAYTPRLSLGSPSAVLTYKWYQCTPSPETLLGGETNSRLYIDEQKVGKSFKVEITATNFEGSSSSSTDCYSISSYPGAPTSLVAASSNGSVTISFTAPSYVGNGITSYLYSTDGTNYVDLSSSSSPVTISGLTNGTTYSIRLKARNSTGNSLASSAVSVTPASAPGAPTVGVATATGPDSASIAFTAPTSNGGSAITSYTVTSSPGSITATGTSSPISISGLSAGTAYTFTVKANNSAGSSVASSASASISTNAATAPGAPTIGAATATNSTTANVAFTAPTSNGGSAITSYTVTSSPGSITATGTSSPIAITGLTAGTAYTFTVTATNNVGTSSASSSSTSISTDPIVASSAPTNVVGSATGQTTARVTFTAPTSTGGAAITSYVVTSSPSGATCTAGANSTTYECSGLTAGTAYTFSITATNAAGLTSSSSSPSSSITTESAPAPSSGGGGGGGGSPAPEPDPEPSCNAACIAAQNAAAERAGAEKAAAEKVAAEKVAAEKAAAEKVAAEKAVAEKVAAEKAAAVAVAEKTRVDLAAAAAIARAAVEIATAAASAKVEVENFAEAVSSVLSSANSSTADTAKITSDALASIESAPAVASKAARAKSADKAAETAASEVRAAAKAAEKAAKSTKTQELSNPEIVIGSQGAGSTSSQALSQANDVARAAKAAAKQVAATAATKASESKAAVETLQSDVDAAIAEVSAQQEIATTLALEAKNAAEIATAATAEKIAATSAAKSAAETLLALLTEKVTLAEQASNATTQEILLQVQQQIESVNLKIAEAEKTLQETSSKAELAIAAQSQAVTLAERTKASTEAQLAKVEELQTLLPSKTQAVVRAIKAAAVAEKVATAANQAAAKIPSSAVIARKPGISTGKNSTRATISGLKPGQKVKVIVNVKPGGKP